MVLCVSSCTSRFFCFSQYSCVECIQVFHSHFPSHLCPMIEVFESTFLFFTLLLSWIILTKQQLHFSSTYTGNLPKTQNKQTLITILLSVDHKGNIIKRHLLTFWVCKMITKAIFTRARCFPLTCSQVLADYDQGCLTQAWNAKQNKFSGWIVCTQNVCCLGTRTIQCRFNLWNWIYFTPLHRLSHTCEYFTAFKMNKKPVWSLRQLHTTKTQE